MKVVDLSVLNKLVEELNNQANSAVKAKDSNNAIEYVVELGKMQGLLSLVNHESTILSAEILKVYSTSSAEAMNVPASGAKTSPHLKSLIDILPVSIKEPNKKN